MSSVSTCGWAAARWAPAYLSVRNEADNKTRPTVKGGGSAPQATCATQAGRKDRRPRLWLLGLDNPRGTGEVWLLLVTRAGPLPWLCWGNMARAPLINDRDMAGAP